ncbi:MAG: TAXI family TRAP transporter solute-binding subunit, partial [Bacteroidales bacterium]|nr:TAXI family TRAP transporter solute-binding subunit [Bacteroidales bacterium]
LGLLKAAGLKTDSFSKWARLGASESADELSNGTLDAYVWSGGIPTGSVSELANTLQRKGKKIALVSLDPQGKAVQAYDKEFPGLANPITIPAKVYGTAEDVASLGFWNQFLCPASMPDDAAYAITKAVFEHVGQLQESIAAARDTTVENNLKFIKTSPIPFHDGALRYFEEVGAKQ